MERIKGWLGLGPESEEDMVVCRVLEVWGELAAALNLPREASVSQLKGAVAALQAGEASLKENIGELAVLKERLVAKAAEKAVGQALQAGKISPAQKDWALEYFRQDPEGFATYVARAPKVVPVGESLSLARDDRSAAELRPEELALCRSLNLAPEEYLKAKEQTAGK
jgi:phage I-like protein